jgi:ribosomal protein S1
MTQSDRWDAAEEKFRTGEHVQADVYEANKGGLMVRVLGLRAFLPAKLTAVGGAGDWVALVGERIEVRFLEVKRQRNRVVVCQVPWKGELEEDRRDA